jgi:shikimate kinase
MKTNIALIGFMGTGKSVVGQALAAKTGRRVVETDSLIEQKAGKSIQRIFREDGENTFRELETRVIQEIAAGEKLVIDCGGGVSLNPANTSRLKQNAVIVWLTASPEVIVQRTGMNCDVRPLLDGMKGVQDIAALAQNRKPFYKRAADIAVDTSRLSIPEVVDYIRIKLKDYENSDS